MNRMTALGIEQAETREDLQSKVERLEVCVCALLLSNQTLRMELLTEREAVQSSGYSHDLSALSPIGFAGCPGCVGGDISRHER